MDEVLVSIISERKVVIKLVQCYISIGVLGHLRNHWGLIGIREYLALMTLTKIYTLELL